MFDIGWSELLIIGVVALIVVGPKDLPGMFRTVGQFVGKARGMARDFQNAMNAAAEESGIDDVKSTLNEAASLKNTGLDGIQESMRDYQDSFKKQTKIPKIDAAGEHAARVKAAEAARKAGGEPFLDQAEAKAEKPATKKPATKKPAAKKPATKKPAAKKPVKKPKPASKKKPATKTAAAKKTAKKQSPKKPNKQATS